MGGAVRVRAVCRRELLLAGERGAVRDRVRGRVRKLPLLVWVFLLKGRARGGAEERRHRFFMLLTKVKVLLWN